MLSRDITALEFEFVRRIPYGAWPANWLNESLPGDILLSEGAWGTTGGLLRLTKTGLFVSISVDNVYSSVPIPWVDRFGSIKYLVIEGDRVQLQ